MEAPGQPPISANFPVHIQANEGHLFLTATIAIEDYVAAVLAGESGDFRNDESLKAMAVVVRTYATRFRGQHSAEGFDFCDTTHCQVPSWNDVSSRISAAADFTRGEILLFQGAAASALRSLEDEVSGRGLSRQCRHPDQVGSRLHQGPLRVAEQCVGA